MGPGRSRWRQATSASSALLGTEFDPGNAAVAFGFVGLLLYLIVLGRGLGTVYRLAALRRDPLSIAVLGVAGATLFQWLNGDLYSVAWLFWLTLGWADCQLSETPSGWLEESANTDVLVQQTL